MKCRYWNICPHYRDINAFCMKEKVAKNYYGKGKAAGCYRRMEGKS